MKKRHKFADLEPPPRIPVLSTLNRWCGRLWRILKALAAIVAMGVVAFGLNALLLALFVVIGFSTIQAQYAAYGLSSLAVLAMIGVAIVVMSEE